MNYSYKKKNIKSADGKNIPSLEYIPNINTNSAIVLVYEIFGTTNHIKRLASNLAEKGFIVNIPDIFSRIEDNVSLPYNKEGFQKGISLKKNIGWEIPVMDLVATAATYKQNFEVSILGFCFGGSLAWLSMQKSFIFDKGVCYYGSSIPDFLERNINCPALLHFGKKDKGIPSEALNKVRKYLVKQSYAINIFEYEDADHGFNCEDRNSYNQKAAEIAYKKTINFLRKN